MDLLHYDEPDVDLSREARRKTVAAPGDARWTWLQQHRHELVDVSSRLVTAADRYDVAARKWVDELALDVAEDVVTPATPVMMGLASSEVRTARQVVDLASTHAVHRVLVAGDGLRCSYSSVGCHAHWQSAPPPPDVTGLVREIARRRVRLNDESQDRLPAPESADPADVLRFLRRWPSANRGVRQFDHLDALKLVNAVWWRDRADELWALKTGLRRGVLRRQLGSQYGLKTGQGVTDLVDRRESLLARGIPDEKQARDMRQVADDAAPVDRQRRWVESNRNLLHRLAGELLQVADALAVPDDDRDWLDLLAGEHKDGEYTSRSLVVFAYAADEIQDTAHNSGDEEDEEVRVLLAQVDELPAVRRLRGATYAVDDAPRV